MTREQRLQLRNQKVRQLFDQISTKNNRWRVDAVIDKIEQEMFLAPRTIEAILRGEGKYGQLTLF